MAVPCSHRRRMFIWFISLILVVQLSFGVLTIYARNVFSFRELFDTIAIGFYYRTQKIFSEERHTPLAAQTALSSNEQSRNLEWYKDDISITYGRPTSESLAVALPSPSATDKTMLMLGKILTISGGTLNVLTAEVERLDYKITKQADKIYDVVYERIEEVERQRALENYISGESGVVAYLTATSTNATSTFAHDISIASSKEYRIGGVGVLTKQSNEAIILGDITGDERGLRAIDIQSGRGSQGQVASGEWSLAFGTYNTASGYGASAFGNYNTASDQMSSAFGAYNTASGYGASTFGIYNTASGAWSSAFGIGNTASADYSAIFGYSIVNDIADSVMVGPSDTAKLTILSTGEVRGSFFTATSTNANSFAGDVAIGTTSPTAQLHTTGSVRFENFGAGTLTTDANGNVSVSSDERLKEIEGVYHSTSSIMAILGINPIQYRWASSTGFDTETVYTGFSAQNVQEYIPEAVFEDKHGFLTLSDRPIIATIINALKDMWYEIVGQNARIEALETRIEELERELDIDSATTSISSVSEEELLTNELGDELKVPITEDGDVTSDEVSMEQKKVEDSSEEVTPVTTGTPVTTEEETAPEQPASAEESISDFESVPETILSESEGGA